MARQGWGRALVLTVGLVLGAAGCTAAGTGTGGGGASGEPKNSSSRASADRAGAGTLPGLPSAAEARSRLDGLKVAPHGSMSGYSRSAFSHWAQQGDKCDTRETVLRRDGSGVRRDENCRAVSGTWVSVYDGKTLTSASQIDIDHVVPLANAWRSGARTWDTEKRKAFANDLTGPQLIAVSAASNRAKGDQGPDEWQPPSRAYWCTYARAWTGTKAAYGLSVTVSEKATLTEMLDTCRS
ncbi:HNH endonuclease family protein [Streptomyces coeruleoprunus]|uniref:HNH endonuclease family protein n=1 Tax=Streptomyces coeruleoprunus TaxID=285563 RepID=A0ABV9XG20_9ACTN